MLPGLRVIRCYDIVTQAGARFARGVRSAHPGLAVHVCATPDKAARGADVIVSAVTMGDAEPFLGPDTLTDGALAVALDYDAAWSPAAMAACDRFYCDDTAQVLATKAHDPHLQRIPDTVAGDLGELAVGAVEGRRDETERLFCMNLDIASRTWRRPGSCSLGRTSAAWDCVCHAEPSPGRATPGQAGQPTRRPARPRSPAARSSP